MKGSTLPLLGLPLLLPAALPAQEADPVPVTIRELDVQGALREFQQFQQELERHRQEVAAGQSAAVEIAQILEELQATASPENGYNEKEILQAIQNYVDTVVVSQVGLVDFLESQRFRISYYANKMASSVRPEDVTVLFGTEEQNVQAIEEKVREVAAAQEEIARFLDSLPEDQFDKRTFRPRPGITPENARRLQELEFRYQHLRNGLELAKNRLSLVRRAGRATQTGAMPADLNVDLLLGQMFGALDRIRMQMSADLMQLELYLGNFAQTAHTQEIFQAFQRLVETQGGLDNPSPGLANVLDWLQESSSRHLRLGASTLNAASPNLPLSRSSDLLREAYTGARPDARN